MTRRAVTFSCEGEELFGTLDMPVIPKRCGLVIVTGGNEVRAGAWNGQAQFAARIAASGYPVFRFDRRGTGDSAGTNAGFRASGPDIAAAIAAFRDAVPGLHAIVGFGNCDAASALMLGGGFSLDGLILSNPWTFDEEAPNEAPAAVLREHYRRRLADPAAVKRLLTGKVPLGGLLRSLAASLRPAAKVQALEGLAREMELGMVRFNGPLRFLVAGRDRTGQAFTARWNGARKDQGDPRIVTCPEASHSYVEPQAQTWLAEEVLDFLGGFDGR